MSPVGVLGGYFLELSQVRPGDSLVRYDHPRFGLGWLHFANPLEILAAKNKIQSERLLQEAQARVDEGLFAVGFVSYEALAPAEFAPPQLAASFALYEEESTFYKELAPVYADPQIRQLASDLSREAFGDAFQAVKEALGAGDCYQVNLSFRMQFKAACSAIELFSSRCGVEVPEFSAYLSGDDWEIVSLSPELFFRKSGREVEARPMKGTAPISGGPEAGAALVGWEKTRAENLMIVDMMRNDLGAVSEIGSVSVPELFTLEKHRSVYQVTSTVASRTDLSAAELLSRLMPPASVTGAPKKAACEAIARLERSPHGAYCGAIGMLLPGGDAQFSVGIRTAWISEGVGTYGVGAGIVWDSDEQAEYDECLLKSEVIFTPARQWELRETLGAGSDVAAQADRLRRSAQELGLEEPPSEFFAPIEVRKELLGSDEKIVVGLRRDGTCSQRTEPSAFGEGVIRVCLAARPISSTSLVHEHKTNSRQEYERIRVMRDVDDVLLYNENGLVTEFTMGGAVLSFRGALLTPRAEGGRLDSVTIRSLVDQGRVAYANISVEEIGSAAAIYLANAVVGLRQVVWVKS